MDKKKLAIIGGILGVILLFIGIGVAVTFNNDEVVEKEKEKEVASKQNYTADDYKELGIDSYGEEEKNKLDMENMPSPELEDVPNKEELEKQKEELVDIVIEDKKDENTGENTGKNTGEKTGGKTTIKATEGSTVKNNSDGSVSTKTEDVVIKKPAEVVVPKEGEKVVGKEKVVEVPKTVVEKEDVKDLVKNTNEITEKIKTVVPDKMVVYPIDRNVVVKDGESVVLRYAVNSDAELSETNTPNYKYDYNNMFSMNRFSAENSEYLDIMYNSLKLFGFEQSKNDFLSNMKKASEKAETFTVGRYEFRVMSTGVISINWDNK